MLECVASTVSFRHSFLVNEKLGQPIDIPSRVSVGLSSFNAEDSIRRAMDSAREQAWSNLEIVVVDDGSRDSSPTIIRNVANIDSRVVPILLSNNVGIPSVRNLITMHSTGEFIAFFDDDDFSASSRVECQVEAIKAHELEHLGCTGLTVCNTSLVVTSISGRTEDSSALGSSRFPASVDRSTVIDHAIRYLGDLRGERLHGTGSMMVRRSTLERLGGFDETFRRSSDVDLVVRLVENGGCIIGLPERLVHQSKTVSFDKGPSHGITARMRLIAKHGHLIGGRKEVRCVELWVQVWYGAHGMHFAKALRNLLLSLVCCPVTTARRVCRQLVPRLLARIA